MSYNERAPCHGMGPDGFDAVVRVPERDHNKLENRDEANQHPIRAISGLRRELNGMSKEIGDKIGTSEVMTNAEIQQILDM